MAFMTFDDSLLFLAVDGDPVPVPHFGMALEVQQFHELAEQVRKAGIKFILEPHLRFEGVCPTRLSCMCDEAPCHLTAVDASPDIAYWIHEV